jgi:hypothetical protein
MKAILFGFFIYSVVVLAPAITFSQDGKDWEFELAPFYLWALSIDGDMGIRGKTASVGVEFSDIWDNLQGVFTVRFNAMYRKKFGLLFDYNYLDLGKEKLTDVVNAEVEFKAQILNLAGTYRVVDNNHILDAVAGIRYTIMDAGIDLKNIGQSLNGDEDWVDPIVGLRYAYQINDKWALRLYGDIGGFGVSSDFTWQGLGMIDFQPWKNVAFVAGYRGIGTDYESGSGTDTFTYDAVVHGPVIGLDIRW